jgi:hypothetical protein
VDLDRGLEVLAVGVVAAAGIVAAGVLEGGRVGEGIEVAVETERVRPGRFQRGPTKSVADLRGRQSSDGSCYSSSSPSTYDEKMKVQSKLAMSRNTTGVRSKVGSSIARGTVAYSIRIGVSERVRSDARAF